MSAARSVLTSAKLIALCTLTSRITGLARDVLLAQYFGLGWIPDAFHYAFQFPNLFRRLFGEGALAAAFVPTFTRTLEEDGRASAWRLLARTLALMTITVSALIVVIAAILGLIWLLSGGGPEQLAARKLLLSLTLLMLPFMLTICVLALFASVLNCVGSFVPAALAPVLLNVCMITAIAWIGPALFPDNLRQQVYVVAITVVVAGMLQILAMLPVLRAHGVPFGWRWEPSDPTLTRMFNLVLPVILGQGVLVIGVYLDAQICILLTHKAGTPQTASLLGLTFAYPLEEGALSALTYAQRLYQFPLGVLVISLATAALPAFSRLATRQAWDAWAGEVRQSLRLAVFEGVLAGTMMILLAEPIIRLLFERGQFTPADTLRSATILRIYGFGLWAFCVQHIVLRAFYSLSDVRTPLIISVALLPINVTMSLILVWFDGVRESAFAISTCTTSTLSVATGLVLLHRRVRISPVDLGMCGALGRMLLSGLMAGSLLAWIKPGWAGVVDRVPPGVLARLVETFGLLAIGSGAYLVSAWLLRLREVRLLLGWPRPPAQAE
jgi:putative peptidoglycan lipid II flippase